MPVAHARQITLTASERRWLKKLARSHTAPYQQVIRVRIVLDAACGYANAKIARRRGVTIDTVRHWRARYADERMAGLADRDRSGRPPRFTPVQVAEAKALACQLPAETGVPLSRWSSGDLAAEVMARGIAPAISAATVRRILAADALKPWQYRSWLFVRDPGEDHVAQVMTKARIHTLDDPARTLITTADGTSELDRSSPWCFAISWRGVAPSGHPTQAVVGGTGP